MKRFVLLAPVVLGLLGCVDLDEVYTLNPDGSGKVLVRMVYSTFNPFAGDAEKDSPEAMKESVRTELEKSVGVEAWKDISFKRCEDGKIEFQGTAYFRNFAKLKLHRQGFEGPVKQAALKRLKDGSCEVRFSMEEKKTGKTYEPPPSEEEIERRIRMERNKFSQMKAMMGPMLGDLRFRIRLHLPGTLKTTSNMKKEENGSVGFLIEGTQMLEVMDACVKDDVWMREQASKGVSGLEGGDDIMEKLLGAKGPPMAVYVPGTKPRFDYAAESAAAKKAFPAMVKRLGIEVAAPAPPAQGGSFKSLRIIGVRLIYEFDKKQGFMPLNTNEPGLTFAVQGELPGRVLEIKEGMLLAAVTDKGQDLLPERDWNRKIHFPKLSKDKQSVLFDVQMKPPPKGTAVLKEVSGILKYSVGGKVEEKNLGLPGLTAGAQGKEFGAKIEKIGRNEWKEGHQNLDLKLSLERGKIESVVFYDAAGNVLEVNPNGYMSGGRSTTLSFSKKGTFPPNGRIALKLYVDLKNYEAPFKLQNIPVMGR